MLILLFTKFELSFQLCNDLIHEKFMLVHSILIVSGATITSCKQGFHPLLEMGHSQLTLLQIFLVLLDL